MGTRGFSNFLAHVWSRGTYVVEYQHFPFVVIAFKFYKTPPDIYEHIPGLPSKIWISMGLCWSSNAQVHKKENYPYKYAAAGSTQLWKNLTSANVILQIIYSESEITNVYIFFQFDF